MSSDSHAFRLKIIERDKQNIRSSITMPTYKIPRVINYNGDIPDESAYSNDSNAITMSLLSSSTNRTNPRIIKENDLQRYKSQDIFINSNDPKFKGSNIALSKNYAPSIRSLKSSSVMGPRATSRASLASMSHSLGASKASISSQKSTIQQEYHDIKVKKKLNALWFGIARKPFMISMGFFVFSFLFLVSGLTVLFLRGFGNIFLSLDVGEAIGPVLIALSIMTLAFGIKFITQAYKLGARERHNIKFRGDNTSMVNVIKGDVKKRPNEMLVTGTNTKQAVGRTLTTDLRVV